jgi:Flp pilus assembly protein CpaB
MSRRARALVFVFAAVCAAAAAAAIADGYGASVARGYGELQTVVVATDDLEPGQEIDPRRAAAGLELRRVPARFVPPGALAAPTEAVGLVPEAAVPAGSYLLSSQLRLPHADGGPAVGLGHGRRPVVISVSGAEALLVSGVQPAGARVDVVVTTEPAGAGPGRTYVAAAAVPLLGLAPDAAGTPSETGGTVPATLGLTRSQALRLIAAESFARQVTILPRG